MKTQSLIDSGIVWHASKESDNYQASSTSPEAILSQGYYHEFFAASKAKVQGCCPTSVLLPFIGQLQGQASSKRLVVFLGKEVWPTPFSLRDHLAPLLPLTQFLFIDPSSQKNRQRALEILCRSSNVLVVVTCLQKISFAFTQKLYLFSKGSRAFTFIFRDLCELNQKSSAHSRWEIMPISSNTNFPSWNITLLHSKGASQGEKKWLMEGINEEKVFMHLLSQLVSRTSSEDVAYARSA